VCGNPVTGKSTLLNFIASMFEHEKGAGGNVDKKTEFKYRGYFEVGRGVMSTTQGVDFLVVKDEEKEHNFIILDLEGDNDPARKSAGVWFFTNLISIITGVSHINIYNFNRIPQQSFLDYFRTCKQQEASRDLHPDFKSKYVFVKRDH
jgi:hypothetical protein